jgi:hypothetical protein
MVTRGGAGFVQSRRGTFQRPQACAARCGSETLDPVHPGAAFYLLMLGLVAEVALHSERESSNEIPTAWEVR